MNEEQLRDIFSAKIEGDEIRLDKYLAIEIDVYLGLFNNAEITFDALMTIDQNKLGFAKYFEQWKDEGIIS